MKMRTPIAALLWELWRVTRVEAAWKLALGVVVALTALIVSAIFAPSEIAAWDEDIKDVGATLARVLLIMPHLVGWLSLAGLNGGRPGFPLDLHYTRPIPTAVIVGLPTAYLTAMSFAIYLVSAFLLRAISGYPFSVLPAAAWIVAVTAVLRAIGWSTRRIVVLTVGSLVALFGVGGIARSRLDSFPNDVDYPLTDYATIALIWLVCFGVTVVSVTRQRRGDAQAAITRTPGSGFRGWLIDLFRFRCPTSSATRAQVWLDLKSDGLPVLTIGVALAILILLLSAIGNPVDAAFADEIRAQLSCSNTDCFYARAWPVFFTPLSLVFVLGLARNAFGIRRRQGRADMSAFEVTQAHGSAQLALLKVLVKSVCVLAAIIAIGVSVWISVSLLGDPVFLQIWNVPLSSQLPAITGAVGALTGYQQLSLIVVVSVGVVIWVAALAVFGALRTRYSRLVTIAASSLLLSGLALALLALGWRNGIVSPFVVDVMFATVRWIFLAAVVFTTVYVFWSGFAERVLTIRYASGAAAISAAFGAAWLTVLHMAGVQIAGMSATDAISILAPALLPLTIGVLAPWSYSRLRHT
jgi:hypothetical protein